MRRRGLTAHLQDAPATLLTLAGVVVLVILAASSAGYPVTAWAPAGLVLLALLLAALLVLPHQLQAVPRPTLVALALLAGYAAWSYVSIGWAGDPGAAWTAANRTLVFVVCFALFALWPQRGATGAGLLGAWVLGIAGIAAVQALRLAGLADPGGLFSDGRLLAPAGYPNANAALFLMACWPALALAAAREVPAWLRGASAGAAVLLAEVALLSQSRGSVLATPVLAVAALVVLPRPRWTLATLALVAGAVAAAAPALLSVRTKVVGDRAGWHDGFLAAAPRAIVLSTVLCALLTGLLAFAESRRRPGRERRRRMPARWPAWLAGAVVVLVVLAILDPGDVLDSAWRSFERGQPTAGTPARLGAGLGSNRYDFYRVALDDFARHPLQGMGADNFAAGYLRHGASAETPRYPHSLELRALSETGIAGALLLFGGLGVALAAGARAAWRGPRLRATAAGGAVLGAGYWVVHGSVDWFFEFGGLGAAAFALLGLGCSLAPAPEIWHRARPPLSRIAAVIAGIAATVALAVLLLLPWLAERDVLAAGREWPRSPGAAYARLDRAARTDPLSDRPLLVKGSIAARIGDTSTARRSFLRALERVPDGAYAYLQLGALAAQAGDGAEALARLERAAALAPRDPVVRAALGRVRARRPLDVALVDAALLGRADATAGG